MSKFEAHFSHADNRSPMVRGSEMHAVFLHNCIIHSFHCAP